MTAPTGSANLRADANEYFPVVSRSGASDEAAPHVASVPQEITGQPRRVVVGRVSWRHTFASLRHRNFRRFFVGQHPASAR